MNAYFLYISMEVFGFRDVWQPILGILTRGSFTLDVQQPPNSPILTHILAPLRATCSAARAMIPAPTKLTPEQLFIEGAKTGNIDLCNLAETYGNNCYNEALCAAVIGGYNSIIDLIFEKYTEKSDDRSIDGGNLRLIPLGKAMKYHRLDICIKLLENAYTSRLNVQYSMSRGAAKGGHMDLIEWIKQHYGLDYDGLLFGAISGNHPEICDMALESGQVDIRHIAEFIGGSKSIEKCMRLRNCLKQHKLITPNFYCHLMRAAAFQKYEDIVKLIHQWSIEDESLIDYTRLLLELIDMTIDDEDPMFFVDDEDMCDIIHEFSKQDEHPIDHDELIWALGGKAKYVSKMIKRWAKEDGREMAAYVSDIDEDETSEDETDDTDDDDDNPNDEDVQEIYRNVQTWNELIRTNIDFLHGIMPESYYYLGPFHDHYYVAGMNRLENDLIRIHEEYAIFTYGGQDNQIPPNGEQRGYLGFTCQPEQGHKLIPKLLKTKSIYTFARRFTKENGLKFYKNIPDVVVLTPPGTRFWLDTHNLPQSIAEIESRHYPNIQRLFRDCYHVFITFREFPQTADAPEITTVLLDNLQKIDAATPV